MEEVNRMKEMITNIFETNATVTRILQEWDAYNNADEEHRRRIDDLEDSFQRLEKRVRKEDEEIQELERTVCDLVPRVDRVTSLVRNYKRHLNKERNPCIPENIEITKRQESRGQQQKGEGSEIPSRQRNGNTKAENVINGHNDENDNVSLTNIPGRNTIKQRSKKKVRFADDLVRPPSVSNISSRGSSMKVKYGGFDENKKRESRENGSGNDNNVASLSVNYTGLKRKVTAKEVDNRLRYFRKMERGRNDTQQIVERRKEGQVTSRSQQGNTSSNSTSMMKDKVLLRFSKDETVRQSETLGSSAGLQDSQKLLSLGQDESLEVEDEDPELVQEIEHKDSDLLETMDNVQVASFMVEMDRKQLSEALKGAAAKIPRGIGPDTVLCLDTSGSMKGLPYQEMVLIANRFVDGVRHVASVLGIEENIGVCTFGKKTEVLLHLTNQYDKVQRVLLSLQAEGPSPMFSGIHMALAACEGNGRRVTMREIPVGSRIILISDGRGTPDHWHLIGDTVDPNNRRAKLLVDNYTAAAGQIVQSRGHSVYSVPVGDFAIEPLERIARISGGYVIQKEEISRLIQFAQHQSAAANYVDQCKELGEDIDREPFLKAMIDVDMTSLGEPELDQGRMDVLTLALKFSKRPARGPFDKNGDIMVEVNTYMPCIGTRVRRGPNWHWGNQDKNGPGTVVGHDCDKMVWVEWDVGGHRNVYHYLPGIHDVTVVDEERVLAAHQEIAVGCKVKRGRDWDDEDQDGGDGTVGVVCRVDTSKNVYVRWPNKAVRRYKFGANGRMEVEPIAQRQQSMTTSMLPPRIREGSSSGKDKETREEISVEQMNRLNQRK